MAGFVDTPTPVGADPVHSMQGRYEDDTVGKWNDNMLVVFNTITENVLDHPFTVLRRQCQLNSKAVKYHVSPFSLPTVMLHLQQRQGIGCLWKGIGSALIVRATILGAEDLISKLTLWPKSWAECASCRERLQMLMLKTISVALATPLLVRAVVESVQSDIASDKPGVCDVFKEGFVRLVASSGPGRGRLLPIWLLVVPTVTYSLGHYLIYTAVDAALRKRRRRKVAIAKGAVSKSSSISDGGMFVPLTATFVSTIVLYPLETVLHRLYLQGSRTIIDNLDDGYSVYPILSNYSGWRNCYNATIHDEGYFGLYKGVGAVVLQIVAQVCVMKLAKFVLGELDQLLAGNSEPRRRH